jgi:predicted transcriptional regulator
MKHEKETVLKVTKEIVVKFIEVGRLSVSSFEEVWNQVHHTVSRSLSERRGEDSGGTEEDDQ